MYHMFFFSPPHSDQVVPPTMLFSLRAIHPSSTLGSASFLILPADLIWPHNFSINFLFLYHFLSPFPPLYLPSVSFLAHTFIPSLYQPVLHFISPVIIPSAIFLYNPLVHSPTRRPTHTHTNRQLSLPVFSDRFCGSGAVCVNVKPFPAMIMFITLCVPCGSRINTNWRSTLQR